MSTGNVQQMVQRLKSRRPSWDLSSFPFFQRSGVYRRCGEEQDAIKHITYPRQVYADCAIGRAAIHYHTLAIQMTR